MSRIHLNTLKIATAELATARKKLADARFQARHGMANSLDFALMVENTVYHEWLRASAAFQASH